MLRLFIAGTDATSHLDEGSVSITEQIQQKANTLRFSMRPGGVYPSEHEEVRLFDAVEIVSLSGTDLVVRDVTASGVGILEYGKFRAGQYLWLGVGEATEERVTIAAIAEGAVGEVDITLEAAADSAHSAGELAGKLIFGGTITTPVHSTPRTLSDVEHTIDATDFTKLFDRKNVNDAWEGVDGRYIVNDFANTTLNYNAELDDMDYADDAAVQAEWAESGTGGNPTHSTDNVQGTSAVLFPWTGSGTATFTASPTSQSVADLVGAATGSPTKGNLTFWYKRSSATGITSLVARTGSSASDYLALTIELEADTDRHFVSVPLVDGAVTGTPDWTANDYLAFVIAETATAGIIIDDVRITAEGSFTLHGVEETAEFDDVRAAFKKPTVFMEELADALGWGWYIDYERDIHLYDRQNLSAPFSIGDGTDNFSKLTVTVDVTQLKNRQVVRGGTKVSETAYSQVVQGDNAVREWILKATFSGLTVKLDDNTSTDTMEATTNTTTVKATAHGLATGDYIVNRTRSNAVRQVVVVDPNTFTVETVASQASGDTFSKFATTKTVGVENLVDETTVDYVSNYTEKSVRASSVTATLPATSFLLFSYNEVVPIRVQVSDGASIAAMKVIVGGDGIFDGQPITDASLETTLAARERGQVELDKFSNPIVRVAFRTDHEGLHAGQLLRVTDAGKSIDADYLIQRVTADYASGGDAPTFSVQCASTLFGIIEYFQRLSKAIAERTIDEDTTVELFVNDAATITVSESNTMAPTLAVSESATVTVSPSETADARDVTTDPYKWQPDASDARWNLAQWG